MNKILYVDRKKIIIINQKIIKMWNQRHPHKSEFVDMGASRIDEVLTMVKNSANELSFEQALIEKAAYLVGGLAWCQAFSGANKRTAILTCTIFLLQNGYRLNIPQNENPELRKLLFDIQEERNHINRQVIDKIILYIRKHVIRS
ncbi:MAG: Fic family protein [Thaumarchaeota archaeon]|nr:Fic family protein [Nitrososphaerota archaeon]